MSIIDKTYFRLDINIPDSTYENLTDYITRFEPEVLRKALGSTLYELMIADQSSSPYVEILEGKDYTVEYGGETHTVKWNGLKNTDKISLIAYYVYYFWQKGHATQTMYTGESKPGFENAASASVAFKLQDAWLKFKELYGYPGQSELAPSLYNFLNEHEDDYPTWEYTYLNFAEINAFDI